MGRMWIRVEIGQYVWYCPLFGEIPHLGKSYTNFNHISCVALIWHLHPTIWKWRKSGKKIGGYAYFPYNKILNSIWFFLIILCTAQCHLPPKNGGNRLYLFKPSATEYIDLICGAYGYFIKFGYFFYYLICLFCWKFRPIFETFFWNLERTFCW